MKTISLRFTDKQHYYLAAVAKDQMRSVEQLLWMAISEGITYMFCEDTYRVEKLACDFTEKDKEVMSKHPLARPDYGTVYCVDHPWAEQIKENVLAQIEGTFEYEDAAFDLQAEITRTADLHGQRQQDHDAKEAAMKAQVAAQ